MGFLFNEKRQMIRKDGSVVENTQKGRSRGPRKMTIGADAEGGEAAFRVSHRKIDMILGSAGPLRDEYERLMENPATLLKHLQAWLKQRGHHVNLTSIRRHRLAHLEQFQKVREASRMAQAFCEIVRKDGSGAILDAAQGRFEMMLMQDLFKMKDNPALPPEEWNAYAKTLQQAAETRRDVERMREEYQRRAKEAVKEAEKGATGKDVVVRMREILGV